MNKLPEPFRTFHGNALKGLKEENCMSLLLVVDVGTGVCRVSKIHYSSLNDLLEGGSEVESSESLPFDDLLIVDRASKTVISGQGLTSVPKGWRMVLL